MFRYRRVFVIAAHAHVGGDPLALEEDFDRPRGQPRVDLGAGEAMGDAIVMSGDLDVIVDTDAAHPPFAVLVGFARQRLERRTIDLFEQLAAGDAEPPDGRSSLSCAMSSPIAASTSARLVKVRRLNRPSSHRSTMSTACSTFALSRGFLGLAGRMAVR